VCPFGSQRDFAPLNWRDRIEWLLEAGTVNELIFVVEDAAEGGYSARALGFSIFTHGDSLDELRSNVREAVACHFDDGQRPKVIRLHFVRDEVLAS
jgi:predicted RNase H-like HicB family nuclease